MNNVQKNILIITTGGTIAMQRDSVTGELTQAISGKSLRTCSIYTGKRIF